MKVITEEFFRKVKPIKLNRDGKIIGHIVTYKDKYYYFSHRTSEHFFRKFQGLGMDKTLLRKMTIPTGKPEDLLFEKINGIIIFYDGEKEKRFYISDPYDWIDGIPYGTAKEFDGDIQTYGEQIIMPIKKMQIIGFHPDDYEAQKNQNALNDWKRFKR